MNIHIIGAGALGLLYGGKLASVGERVTLWTRTAEQATLLRNEGVILEDAGGERIQVDSEILAVHTMDEASSKSGTDEADWIFITTKQRHIDHRLLEGVKKLLGKRTRIACFQNGVGHIDKLRAAVSDHPVYAVITTEGARRISGRKVVRAGLGETKIGMTSNGSLTRSSGSTVESLIVSLVKAGIPSYLSNEIDKEIYRKLLINAVINPLTALWRIPNGELLANQSRLAWVRQLSEEGLQVYQACGIPYDPDMYEIITAVCRTTAVNTSSMLKDVLEGAPTEVDYINGRLVEMARSVDLVVPGHEAVWRLVRSMHQDFN